MLEFLDLQGVINPGQYGFRFGHSSAMVNQDIVERVRGAWDSKRVALGHLQTSRRQLTQDLPF
jgi:Zn-finger domain-containing protein